MSARSLAIFCALALVPGTVAAAPSPPEAGQMVLVRTTRILPRTGDPVWELQLALPGQALRSYEAVVGRADRQHGDRQRLGSKTPLPQGRYRVTEIEATGETDDPELGRFVWIGLEAEFRSARKGLGIHYDPSAGRGRRSGTDGCIGLLHGNDLLVLGDLLRRSGTRELIVKD
ncbi:MAG: L,D-transpeptidase [Cyanobium sp.]